MVTESTLRPARRAAPRNSRHPNPSPSEGCYRGLLEAAPDAMVVVNPAGEIVLLNVQAEKQFGYRRDELVGEPVTNIIPEGFAERLIADELGSTEGALAQVIGTGIELVARRKDRTEFPIELMLSLLQSTEGILVTAAIRDISVRKAAERRLSEMDVLRFHLAALVDSSDDAIISMELDGTITSWNRGAEVLYGYLASEAIGQPISILKASDRPAEIPDMLARTSRGEGLRNMEVGRRRKDGAVLPVSITVSPIRDASGVIIGTSTIARDISERRAAEQALTDKNIELSRSNEELGQFAYIASHDLQEPLRMVTSYTQLLSRRYKGKLDSDADEFIAYAVDGANRMQRLIQDLLAYSHIGTAGRPLEPIGSEGAFDRALHNLAPAIEESGAIVTHDSLPAVMADETQLTQLFQNLVGNAIKYHGSRAPVVDVGAIRKGKKWAFSVKDNGIGIAPEYFDRIFGMFQRLHKREEFDGTGIGLAICKKIVERHGGTISVESAPGQGSTFRFALIATDRRQ